MGGMAHAPCIRSARRADLLRGVLLHLNLRRESPRTVPPFFGVSMHRDTPPALPKGRLRRRGRPRKTTQKGS